MEAALEIRDWVITAPDCEIPDIDAIEQMEPLPPLTPKKRRSKKRRKKAPSQRKDAVIRRLLRELKKAGVEVDEEKILRP